MPPTTATAVALSSSLRSRALDDSLRLARSIALSRGVSRVSDTTWLDRIGVPVYSSVRHDGHPSCLCVHAGKGFTPAEAEIGAYMEAIEYSFAEGGRSRLTWRLGTPEEVLESFGGALDFPEFCPMARAQVMPDERMALVEAEEFMRGLGPVFVPAELVFGPFPDNPGKTVYGTSSNGVASGNTVPEATVHALAEVMERDVQSFSIVGAPSVLVRSESLPAKALEMARRIEAAGLRCHVRYTPNDFALPYFAAYIVEAETEEYAPMSVVTGIGFHCNSDIAVVRAIAEACQSRVTIIHGGRDDLVRQHALARRIGPDQALRHLRRSRALVSDASDAADFAQVPSADARSLAEAQDALFAGMRRAGLELAVRAVYTDPDYPFQVVRVIVPGAEYSDHALQRVGPRLLNHLAAKAP